MKSKTYEEFVEKFKPKLTTDDCYTPQPVYDALVEWAKENLPIEGKRIVRPFWPGADYKTFTYEPDMVVIDNPPFSILSQIRRYYQGCGIPYLLFAPRLTVTSSSEDAIIITGNSITFENGAYVCCAFVTNMLGDIAVMTSQDLHERIKEADKIQNTKVQLPKYAYPKNVITSSALAATIGGGDITIKRHEICSVNQMEAQKSRGKAIFGMGFFVGDKIAGTIAEARRVVEAKRVIVWELSDRERGIIEELNKRGDGFQ